MRILCFAAVAALLFAAPASAQSVTLKALDGAETTLSGEAWTALPRRTVSLTIHGVSHDYSGPLLSSVLAKAGAPQGDSLRGPVLRTVVVVGAADGYRVAFSLAETDPAMRAAPIILADTADGALLTTDGPLRLIVSEEGRPARSVRQVTLITLMQVD